MRPKEPAGVGEEGAGDGVSGVLEPGVTGSSMVMRGAVGGWRGGPEEAGVGREGEEGAAKGGRGGQDDEGREEVEGREWNMARV
jgi:hypothetical protein